MLFYFVLWTISFVNILEVNSFFIQESYRVQLEDISDYKIEESFHEEDYELINKEELIKFKIEDKKNKLHQLKKIARKEFNKNMRTKGSVREWFGGTEPTDAIVTDKDEEMITEFIQPIAYYTQHKREVPNNSSEGSSDYEYKSLIEEYYEEEVEESKSNKSFHATTAGAPENEFVHAAEKIVDFNNGAKNCTVAEARGIGLKALKCIAKDYKSGRQPLQVAVNKLMRIFKIWLCIYLIVAVPLWCSRGWCCCCLFCKFFKPRTTIDEAKRYLMLNPPGVLRDHRGIETHYDPTEYEIESYDKFEHRIRTI